MDKDNFLQAMDSYAGTYAIDSSAPVLYLCLHGLLLVLQSTLSWASLHRAARQEAQEEDDRGQAGQLEELGRGTPWLHGQDCKRGAGGGGGGAFL